MTLESSRAMAEESSVASTASTHQMRMDLQGRLRNTKVAAHDAFLPVFEAIINSMCARKSWRLASSTRGRGGNQEQKDTVDRRKAIDGRLEELRQRKERIVEAYLYEGAINQEIYRSHVAKVEEELTLAKLDRYEAEIDEFDIEGTLAFAEHLVSHSSRLWMEAGLEQRLRLQKLFFPEGLSYDGKILRTPVTCPFFNNLEGTSSQASELVEENAFSRTRQVIRRVLTRSDHQGGLRNEHR